MNSLSTDSEQTFRQIATWLRHCDAHAACHPGAISVESELVPVVLPTRLLHLTPGHSHPQVKIVTAAHYLRTNIRYATLSHCWGTAVGLRLLRSVYDEYCSAIPWSSLPLTFQHTITAALKLDLTYLWIDALCIVQDDQDDWLSEASKMVDVYQNSYLNIAATASVNSSQGLFRRRNPACLQSFLVPRSQQSGATSGFLCYTDRWWTSIEHSPLAERAWTVQERFLAPRILHFAADEVYWECNEVYTAESLSAALSFKPDNNLTLYRPAYHLGRPSQQHPGVLRRLWHAIQSAYAKASLTYVKDRPFAIAGLSRLLCRLLRYPDDQYLCGLWRPWIASDLMWRASAGWTAPPGLLRVDSLPSWSWLSLCRGSYIDRYEGYDGGTAISIECLDVTLNPKSDLFGPMHSAKLLMRAPLCQVMLSKGIPPFYDRPRLVDVQGYGIRFRESRLRADEHFELRLDDESDAGWAEASTTPVYLMLGRMMIEPLTSMGIERVKSITDIGSQKLLMNCSMYSCLVLAATGEHGHFRRIGHVKMEPVNYIWSGLTDEQLDKQRSFAREVLLRDLAASTVPAHICQAPDEGGMYVFSLV